MPWTMKQKKVIRAKEHGWDPPGDEPFEGVSKAKLSKMEKEPTRPPVRKRRRTGMKGSNAADALAGYRRGR